MSLRVSFNEVLGMSSEDRDFIVDFLKKSTKLARTLEEKGEIPPYVPPDILSEQYERVLELGREFCQLKILERIFNFKIHK